MKFIVAIVLIILAVLFVLGMIGAYIQHLEKKREDEKKEKVKTNVQITTHFFVDNEEVIFAEKKEGGVKNITVVTNVTQKSSGDHSSNDKK